MARRYRRWVWARSARITIRVKQVAYAVREAIKFGYRLLDCASVYGNEKLIGEVLDEAFENGTVKREELFIQSKVWNDMHGKGDILLSLAQTLKDLRIDYVDAYYVHWPFPNYHAPGCDGGQPQSRFQARFPWMSS